MIEFFLGIIAFVLVIAFWEKVQPALNGIIKIPVSIIAAPFKLLFMWIKGLMFTFKTFWLITKHSWKNHKILFCVAVLSFFCILISDSSLYDGDVKWLWLIKYGCGLVGLFCSIVSSLVVALDSDKDIMKTTSLHEIGKSDSLGVMIYGYSMLLLYGFYYLFGIQVAMNIYTALFFSFVIVSVLVWLKNSILKKK